MRTRLELVATVETLAQAIVDANRGGDRAGSTAAVQAFMRAIDDHRQELATIEREEQR